MTTDAVSLTVGEIARLAGVTVRTLHHYDEIGLVVPQGRTAAGYRLYGVEEIERLQEVLFFRELGVSLGEISALVGRPGYERRSALHRQRRLLERKVHHLEAMIQAVDSALQAERNGTTMNGEEMLGVFGGFDPAAYEDEVRERWGDTDAYQESAARTAGYGKEEWAQVGAESAEIDRAFAALMEAGEPPESDAAMDLAERHRAHISRWFYECTPTIHAGLGRMYVDDPRFTENIDRTAPGLARFMGAAIAANARRTSGD